VARHERMVALVEQMPRLRQRLAEAVLPQDKTMLQRQIDRLVYGLTEKIGIVEGSNT
jgi:hypothetical protein